MSDTQSVASEYLRQLLTRLSAKQLAKRLGIQPSTLKRWLRLVPITKVRLVEGVYRRSERSRKARVTQLLKLKRKLQAELGHRAVSDQLMRRLQTEFAIAQPELVPNAARLAKVRRDLRSMPGPTISEILRDLNEEQLEKQSARLIDLFGLGNKRELYALYHSGPRYGVSTI